jgi:cell division protein FtsN
MLKSNLVIILAAGLLAGCVYDKSDSAYAPPPPRDGGQAYARDGGNTHQRERVREPTQLTQAAPPPGRVRTEDLGQLSPGSGTAGPDADTGRPVRATPSPARIASTSSRMFVQVASFGARDQAERARRSIAELGPTAIYTAYVDDQLRYRVRVGPFRSTERTEEVRMSLMRRGYNDAIIVRD